MLRAGFEPAFIHAMDELQLVRGVEPHAIVLGIHFGIALCTAGICNSMQKQPCKIILQPFFTCIIEKKLRTKKIIPRLTRYDLIY